jgi:hypothetical protein
LLLGPPLVVDAPKVGAAVPPLAALLRLALLGSGRRRALSCSRPRPGRHVRRPPAASRAGPRRCAAPSRDTDLRGAGRRRSGYRRNRPLGAEPVHGALAG